MSEGRVPTYEYECGKCGHEFEREQPITDEPIKTCPQCKARKARRLISRTSFVLKGSGWYSDLYSSKKDSKGRGDEAGKKDETAKPSKEAAVAEKGSSDKSDSGSTSDSGSKAKPKGKGKGKGAKAAA